MRLLFVANPSFEGHPAHLRVAAAAASELDVYPLIFSKLPQNLPEYRGRDKSKDLALCFNGLNWHSYEMH